MRGYIRQEDGKVAATAVVNPCSGRARPATNRRCWGTNLRHFSAMSNGNHNHSGGGQKSKPAALPPLHIRPGSDVTRPFAVQDPSRG